MPDLARIAETSGLPLRKLRYVLDHKILPGGDVKSRGRGAVRSLEPFEAFGVVVAAAMLGAGLKRALVRDCLALLCRETGRDVGGVPLYRAFLGDGPSRLEVGDWAYVRLTVSSRRPYPPVDTGWLPLGMAEPPASFAPSVALVLDIGQLRGKLGKD
jgi:hypothetical protein